QLEAFRWTPYLKKGGTLIMNTQKIEPMPVITGTVKYPEDIEKILQDKVKSFYSLDALDLAIQAGSKKAVNCVLIGKLAKMMDFDKNIWIDAIKKTVPSKFIDMNIKAFELGFEV
ncbi:MAG: 2-oxoacid:acceptor oxidoreductase family protein, partial [Clostridia bacterium]